MSFTPPPYPPELLRTNWDSNKGLLAKAKGFTGMGQALQNLKADYDKVDWAGTFDLGAKWGRFSDFAAKGFTVAKLEQDVKAAGTASQSGDVAKLRKAAMELKKLAADTAADYGKNPLFKKAATLAREISTAADHLAVACNPNSLSDRIAASRDELMSPIKITLKELANLDRLYKLMEDAATKIAKAPTYETWLEQNTMTVCRRYNQVVGNAAKIADLGIHIGGSAADFTKFFQDMNLYARVQVPFKEDADHAEILGHVSELVKLVKRAKAFRT